jgi:hypothetical protein
MCVFADADVDTGTPPPLGQRCKACILHPTGPQDTSPSVPTRRNDGIRIMNCKVIGHETPPAKWPSRMVLDTRPPESHADCRPHAGPPFDRSGDDGTAHARSVEKNFAAAPGRKPAPLRHTARLIEGTDHGQGRLAQSQLSATTPNRQFRSPTPLPFSAAGPLPGWFGTASGIKPRRPAGATLASI